MRVKAGRKADTYAKVKKARTSIGNVKENLVAVRTTMKELDWMTKSCGTTLARIERNLNTITKDNLVSTPKVTKKNKMSKMAMRKGRKAEENG